MYDDRIEIASPSTFPPQITPENIKEPHELYSHNLKGAEALYQMTYLENWGSGAKRIMAVCETQGVEAPTWRSDGGFVTITFKRPDFKSIIIENGKEDNRRGQVPTKYRSSSRNDFLMSEDYMTMNEIMSNMGFKHCTSFRENYFLPALENGAIKLLYPEQPTHPKQKYRLTESAIAWKKNNSAHSKE